MQLEIKLEMKEGWLRPLLVEDIHEGYVRGLNDPEVNRFLIGPRLRTQTHEMVRDFVQQNLQSDNAILFGIWLANMDKHCGTIRLYEIDREKRYAHIGICIFNKEVWGRGIGSKAIDAVTKWAFEGDLKLLSVEAGAYLENQSSIKAFKAAGYKWMRDIPAIFPIEGLSGVASILVANAGQSMAGTSALTQGK